jgi:hypothetical protein
MGDGGHVSGGGTASRITVVGVLVVLVLLVAVPVWEVVLR